MIGSKIADGIGKERANCFEETGGINSGHKKKFEEAVVEGDLLELKEYMIKEFGDVTDTAATESSDF